MFLSPKTVFQAILRFLRKENQGADLAEYCLITALIALVALGILWHVSGGVQGMWNHANTTLVAGNSASTSSAGDTQSAGR